MNYTESLIELFSVGCILDTDTASVYPMDESGYPDYSCPIELYFDEVNQEWLDALSDEDYETVKPFLNK